MKILVVSDSHGQLKNVVEKMIELGYDDLDAIIHLGDYVEDADRLKEILGKKLYKVAGNGDLTSGCDFEKLIDIKGHRLFLTHGHQYDVSNNLERLYYRALELEADIVLYGHTHLVMNLEREGVLFINPGSPTFPRNLDRTESFILLEIREDEEIEVDIIMIN